MYQKNPNYKHRATKVNNSLIGGIVRPLLGFGKDFCRWTSMHGYNHIAMPRRHWTERLLWVCVTACAVWAAVDISLGQYQRYRDNPTVVTLEKDFRTWSFNYPAITVCYENRVNPAKLPAVIKNTWNTTQSDAKYDYYSKFIGVVANSNLFNLSGYQEFKDDQSLNVDLFKLVGDVMPNMDLRAGWSHHGNPSWFPVMTESGACYVTNSVAITDSAIMKLDPNDTKMFPLSCKYASLTCYVNLEITKATDFYFHSPYDVVDTTVSPNRIYNTLNRGLELSVMETRCGKEVRELSPRRRHCLYTDEPTEPGRQVYSTNSCRISCRSKLAVRLCGCKPFYYFYEDGPPCTPAGLACLSKYSASLRNNSGERCACGQQCVESIFKEVAKDDQYWSKGPLAKQGSLKFTVQPPRTRYTREIVFHFQDLVVSFGGAAGLFLGASFISIVEIFYFLFSKFIGAFVEAPKAEALKVKNPSVSYEMARIKKLTSIIDYQNRYT